MRNQIKARRTELRWSQAELGKALGVSRQTVIALENDKYDPSLPLAFRISALFEAPIEEIFQPETETETETEVDVETDVEAGVDAGS